MLGLVVGIGYSAAVTFTNAVTPTTPHPLAFGLITGSYHVVVSVAAAIIIESMSDRGSARYSSAANFSMSPWCPTR